MVAKITFPKRVQDALNYHEKKVQRGVAHCLGAGGYLRAAAEMNFYQKLEGLQRRNELNSRAATRTLHVSLNFHPSERLADEVLRAIASEYLERIGFGAQPYLVYRHNDAAHPHLHIVSTTIRADGSRIATHNLGRHQSERARRELEVRFGLMRAEGRKAAPTDPLKPLPPEGVHYGKAETKWSLARVVGSVMNHYAFCSLSEFNAALRPFNVQADAGKEGGRLQRHGGLVYCVLDEKGERVGVPVKASALRGKPTRARVEARFAAGVQRKQACRGRLKEKLDRCFAAAPSRLEELVGALGKEGVFMLPHHNRQGRLYGLTFVDHETRCVFKDSDLGRSYSAPALQARLAVRGAVGPHRGAVEGKAVAPVGVSHAPRAAPQRKEPQKQLREGRWADLLLPARVPSEAVPLGLLPKKRRQKKRRPGT